MGSRTSFRINLKSNKYCSGKNHINPSDKPAAYNYGSDCFRPLSFYAKVRHNHAQVVLYYVDIKNIVINMSGNIKNCLPDATLNMI